MKLQLYLRHLYPQHILQEVYSIY